MTYQYSLSTSSSRYERIYTRRMSVASGTYAYDAKRAGGSQNASQNTGGRNMVYL